MPYPNYTVTPSGQGGDFNTLQGAINDLATNYATLTSPVTIKIDGTWVSADTTAVSVSGITTSATNTITIYTTSACRHPGYWADTSPYYRLKLSANAATVLYVSLGYTTISGIQAENTYAGGLSYSNTISINLPQSTAPGTVLDGIIAISNSSDAHSNALFDSDANGDSTVTIKNSAFISYASAYTVRMGGYYHGTNQSVIYNCVAVNCASGFGIGFQDGYAVAFINCYAYSLAGTNAFSITNAYSTLTTCASSDTTGSIGLQNIAYSTTSGTYFTNVTQGSENFTLNTGSALIGAGTNESGTFTNDIINLTRQATGAWDIGPFRFGALTVNVPPLGLLSNPLSTVEYVIGYITKAITIGNI